MLSAVPLLTALALASPPTLDTQAPPPPHAEHTTEPSLADAARLPLGVGVGLASGALTLLAVGRALWVVADAPERALEALAFGMGIPLVGTALLTTLALFLVHDPGQALLRGAVAPFATIVLSFAAFAALASPAAIVGAVVTFMAAPFLTQGEARFVVPALGALLGGLVVAPIVAFTAVSAVVPTVLVGLDLGLRGGALEE